MLMGLESVQSHMSHLGTSALLYGFVREADEILQEYERVTRDEIQMLAQELFQFEKASLSTVGRGENADDYIRQLSLNPELL